MAMVILFVWRGERTARCVYVLCSTYRSTADGRTAKITRSETYISKCIDL